MPDGKRQWMPADQWAVRENLREFIDHLTQIGQTVHCVLSFSGRDVVPVRDGGSAGL